MMTLRKKITLAAAAIFLSISAVPLVGIARSTTAIDRYVAPADASCFQESWGSQFNTCSTTKGIFFPAVIDSSGYKSVTVTAKSNDASKNVCCHALGVSNSSASVWGSGWACLPSFGTPQNLVPTSPQAYVPSFGSMYVYCDMGAGAQIGTLEYNP